MNLYGVDTNTTPPIECHTASGEKFMTKREAEAVVRALARYGVPSTAWSRGKV